ncbi:LuxR C-terminal-related transcriptional regulator [Geitlerinema splendidum]|jgi:DNA-binding CsgD family transcriptional regulator|nr:LuxR C-terminal-related transcriptional regulator [Geitlerinema splendidum]
MTNDEINGLNRTAFEYDKIISSQLAPLCDPFLKAMGLTTFLYGRIFYDGRYIILSNNIEWVKTWFLNIPTIENTDFHKKLQSVSSEEPFYYMWCTAPDSKLIQLHNSLGIWHGFDISFRLEDSVEGWSFSTSQDRYEINNFYLNNIKIFHRFILHLKERAPSLFEIKDDKQLAVFKNSSDISFQPLLSHKEEVNNFLSSLPSNGYSFSINNTIIKLSPREVECVFHFSQGKTSKEIAKILNISHRTVENYIKNVKLKTGQSNKSVLADMLKDDLFKWL